MLTHWSQENDEDDCACNQKSFQKAVFENGVNGRSLPLRYFVNGELYFERMPKYHRKNVVVLHNNFLIGKHKKILRFKDFKLWQTDSNEGLHIFFLLSRLFHNCIKHMYFRKLLSNWFKVINFQKNGQPLYYEMARSDKKYLSIFLEIKIVRWICVCWK